MTDITHLKTALAGRYEVDREVGEGGMATVYLARDLKHDRRVALKVLKPELGAVLGVERFLAEIKVTANLQHPNLLPLFDSGAAEGLLFYVMPFVEGESLRARLDREKQLPIDEAVHIGAAVASALDYAHRQGVIHRDLKPENILLHEGQPLVADFGIALAVSNAGGGRITQTGLSLGTPQYMSPEQATGDRAVDGRTDIYSLGAVTYEILTGEAPHTGSTSQAVIARVLTEKPRGIRVSRPNVPAHVAAAVEHALEKLPADRFATAKEFADGLTGKVMLVRNMNTGAAQAGGGRTSRRNQMALMGMAALLVAAAATSIVLLQRPRVEPPVIRFSFPTPRALSPLGMGVSPDGETITFAGVDSNGATGLWARHIGTADTRPVVGTVGSGGYAGWAPHSREFVFHAAGALKRIPREGGAATTVASADGAFRGASWNAEDMILYSLDGEIYRVAAAGGATEKITPRVAGVGQWEMPYFLPDGRRFLVLARAGPDTARGLYVASIDGNVPTRIGLSEYRAEFAPPNWVLFGREGTLFAQALDLRSLRTMGSPVPISPVGLNSSNGSAGFGVSATGVLATRATSAAVGQLRWYSRTGVAMETIGAPGALGEFALSPDGRRVAVLRRNPETRVSDVWCVELSTNIATRVTSRREGAAGAVWTPDSRSVVFRAVNRTRPDSTYLAPISGGSDSLVLAQGEAIVHAESYSPDGETLLMRQSGRLFARSGNGNGTLVTVATLRIEQARFSPDGRSIAYGSNESGRWEVYVASYPGMGNRRKVSAAGGQQPRWRGDGRELYFLTDDGQVMVAEATAGATPTFEVPHLLFRSPLASASPYANQYDVAADGRRFLFAPQVGGEYSAPSIDVVVNWTRALGRP